MTELRQNFIRLQNYDGRTLFTSDATGPFWSLGVNAFMDTWENDPLKQVVQTNGFQTVYENQFRRLTEYGFNTLSGWSEIGPLKERIPFGIVLFDDEEVPTIDPLINVARKEIPEGDSGTPCPVCDPYSKQYQEALDKYIKFKVSKYKNSKNLLCYWIGHEFGWGDTNAIDFSDYLYSKGVTAKLQEWLISKYKTVETLNSVWKTEVKNFEEAAQKTNAPDNSQHRKDLQTFATLVVNDWFALVIRTIKKYDPNHLISSPKLSVYDHREYLHRPLSLGHFESFRGHFDLLSVDMYTAKKEYPAELINDLRGISYMLGLPVLVSEFGTREEMQGWSNTPGAPKFVASQQERSIRYRSQVMQLFAEPWIVGVHWFKWGDHFSTNHQMNKGMVTVKDDAIVPYDELVKSMSEVHGETQRRIQQAPK